MTETWVAYRGYMAGEARIGRVEKETEKTLSVNELWAGTIQTRTNRKNQSDILGRYPSRESAQKAVDHARRMFDQHKEKVDQAFSVHRQATICRDNAFLQAFK